MSNLVYENAAFSPFEKSTEIDDLAAGLTLSLNNTKPHPLCQLAVNELQTHLQKREWNHNFGMLSINTEVRAIGKMFGVLVVRTKQGKIGYLSAFSGKLANANHHDKFVPPIFDGLAEGGFLNAGMKELTQICEEINNLEALKNKENTVQIRHLKAIRKSHSVALQNKLFDQYHFLNRAGQSKSLLELFEVIGQKPPAGAGECAAPKLLQYAFRYEMEPLALAEFWWGKTPKSINWEHGHFYPPCLEKCAPILAHMLDHDSNYEKNTSVQFEK